MTATVTKTALKKLSRAASNFIALILSRLIHLSGVELLKTVPKIRKKKERRCLVLTSFTKR